MSKIIGYTVLTAQETKELDKIVMEHVELGFRPIGGVSYSPENGAGDQGDNYFQAMIKYEDNNDQTV